MRLILALCLLLLLTAQAADAHPVAVLPVPVRMVTYIGEKLEGIRPDFSWVLSYEGKRYQLYVLDLDVLDARLTALDIDAAVRLYPVQFRLAGEKSTLARFIAAPPRQQVLITGYMRLDPGARFFILDTVDAAYLPTPAATN